MLPPGEAHYLRHVVAKEEWPEGTTLSGYCQSLEDVIHDPNSGVFVNRFSGAWQIGFARKSGNLRGPEGYEFVIIEYRVDIGHWITGFQPKTLDEVLSNKRRSDFKWLRSMK